MNPKTQGVIVGCGGLFAGLLAAQLVEWNTVPKAALAVAVAVAVSLILLLVLRPKTTESRL